MVMHYNEQSTKHMETITVYKLFRQEADGLHPLFIDSDMVLPIGQWIEARAPSDDQLRDLPEGFHMIQMHYTDDGNKYTTERPSPLDIDSATWLRARWVEIRQGKRGRKVYDLGLTSNGQVLRFAHRPGWHTSLTPSLPGVNMDGKVWAECLIPADDYYTLHRNISGLSQTHEPIDWLISKKLFIVRLLE